MREKSPSRLVKYRISFWNLYVRRPPAAVLVAGLAGTRVTPNQITLSAVFVALASVAVLLLVPGYVGTLAAIVIFQLSYVLDCADGMLRAGAASSRRPGTCSTS